MRRTLRTPAVLGLVLAVVLSARAAQGSVPQGWRFNGPKHYFATVTEDGGPSRGRVVVLIGRTPAAPVRPDFSTLMQRVRAQPFHGKRLRLSANVRTSELTGWAGLWMRVDSDSGDGNHLAFDNMEDRAITGTTQWRRYEVVLDVEPGAHAVAFGVLTSGVGETEVHDLRLEEVGRNVPVTGSALLQEAPANLDFAR